MEEHFGVCVALYKIGGFIELFYNGLLLAYGSNFVEALCKIFFGVCNANVLAENAKAYALLKQMSEVAKELFVFVFSRPSLLISSIHFSCAAGPAF